MSDQEDDSSVDMDEEAQGVRDGDEDEEEIRADEQVGEDSEKSSGDEDDDDKEPQVEEEQKDPDVALTADMIAECLSLLCKTGNGLAHAYARFEATERALTDISMLASFIHLRYVNLSKNNLRCVSPLNSLAGLLTIQLDNNKLTTADVPTELPYLQSASFASNKIKTLAGISHPLLERLNLSHNEISLVSDIEPSHLSSLQTLELRGNKLTSLSGLNLPTLKNLYLASNQIESLEGADQLESLAVLHLRENQLQSLDGFTKTHGHLAYVNMRANNIADLQEIKKLDKLEKLTALVLSDNPVAEDDDYRLEVLVALRNLDRLDKDKYIEEEKEEAVRISEERIQNEEILAEREAEKVEVPMNTETSTLEE